jgi:FG-GAP repeat
MIDYLKSGLKLCILTTLSSSTIILSLGSLGLDSSWAASFDLTQTFYSPHLSSKKLFANSVAISGNNVLIGTLGDDEASEGDASDRVYLFDAETGNLPQIFYNPTPPPNNPFSDQFGFAVAIDSDKALIGAPFNEEEGSNSGAAYLFDTATGDLLQTFLNPTPENADEFGYSVSISGNKILIGAPADGEGEEAFNSGAAYLFDATTGVLLQTFLNPTSTSGDRFGSSLAISGDKVLIGAFLDSEEVESSGAVYLFDATTGNLLQTFRNPKPALGDVFGSAVAIDGDKILIGARADDKKAMNSGTAYLFDATTGERLHTFSNPTPGVGDVFGVSVALKGNNVLIGASADDEGAENSGAAYLFDVVTGELVQTFLNPTPALGDLFGNAVALSKKKVLIGAFGDDDKGANKGAAYLFQTTDSHLKSAASDRVPEPSTLLGVAIAGLSMMGLRKVKRKS